MTAIQRLGSTKVAADAAKSIKFDLHSTSSLTFAFKNQDVVISAVPLPTPTTEKFWIEAAIAAGVKRIVLSEYSTNLEAEPSKNLPIVTDKVEIREFVKGLAAQGKVQWMSVNAGPFMEPWLWLSGWFGANVKTGITTLHDGGEKIVCTTTLDRIGEAVARGLLPEYVAETKNQAVYVYSAPVTEGQITRIVEKITGSKLPERHLKIADITKEAFEALGKGDASKMMNFYATFAFGDGYGGDFRQQAWNEKLGFKEMSDGEIEALFRSWLKVAT